MATKKQQCPEFPYFGANYPDATCKTCVHRARFSLNEYSRKVIQCCLLQKSKRSNSGYKTIKVTDKSCFAYKKED